MAMIEGSRANIGAQHFWEERSNALRGFVSRPLGGAAIGSTQPLTNFGFVRPREMPPMGSAPRVETGLVGTPE